MRPAPNTTCTFSTQATADADLRIAHVGQHVGRVHLDTHQRELHYPPRCMPLCLVCYLRVKSTSRQNTPGRRVVVRCAKYT
eukprot:4834581-Prymnesium_polylepis.2